MRFSFLLPLLLLAACTHAPTRESVTDVCAGVDWWEAGRAAGSTGAVRANAEKEAGQRCAGTAHPLAKDLFENGFEAGLVEYCTPSQGLATGRSGLNYNKSCPAYLEPEFVKQFEIGSRIHSLEIEHSDLSQRIETLELLLKKSTTGTALKAQIDELETKRLALDVELGRLEAAQPNSFVR